ncbi:MAG: TonB-dependent receptor [Erythrobacter sp.]|uniref:TonB-dependent receptor n=1 Tax=Erythrobacter sp. TaxID=1042 RepID=UPI0025F644AB|nr:TonB-dependent receptor [Erythrobacter sp.]MCL9998098.1 TonB-dependent receptor [Erythrobacter sp.]
MFTDTTSFSRNFWLAGTGLAALAMTAPAHAQDTAAGEPAEDANEIIVTGSIRGSLENATETKRQAVNLVDVATADSVGRFPDENVAAALARLPGVAVQLDQGQARYIQVRGAPNRWTSVSIDGLPQTGTDEGGGERAFRFDAVPAVLLQQLVVNKTLTPDITAEAITALVDLQTFSPIDDGKAGFGITGDAGYGLMSLGEGQQRSGSLRVSWTNDRVGFALGGSHYLRDQVTDNREAGYDAAGVPIDIDIRNYELTRENNGLFGAFEFRPSNDLKFFVTGIFTEFRDREERHAYEIEIGEAAARGTRGLLSGSLDNVSITTNYNDGIYINQNYIGSAGFDWQTDEGGLKGIVGYTRTENTTDLPLIQSSIRSISVDYDRSNDARFPVVRLFRTVNTAGVFSRGAELTAIPITEQNLQRTVLIPIVQGVTSDAYSARLDGWKQLGDLKVSGGLYVTQRDITGNNIGIGGVVPLAATGFNPNSFATDRPWDTQFPLGVSINYVDTRAMNRALQEALARNNINPANFVLPTSFYDQEERIYAGYVMAQWNSGPLQVVAGVRAEQYEIDNAGTVLIGAAPASLAVAQDFFDLFPSLNIRYEATENLVLRLGGQRGVSRPAYAAIRVGASISDTAATISGGNPFLTPEYTWGLDVAAEYYFASNGIASVTGFHRWVEDVLYQSQQRVGSDLYNSGGIDRSNYLLGSTFNGESGSLYGVEFNIETQFDFLPGALAGLGVQGNLTLLGGDFDARNAAGALQTFAFQGLSDTVLNASVFYEYAGLSLRVAYQKRTDFLDTIGGLGAGEFRQGFENLDVTARYALTPNITLFADLANLTDETYVAYEGSPATPSEVERIGERYLFGVRFNF